MTKKALVALILLLALAGWAYYAGLLQGLLEDWAPEPEPGGKDQQGSVPSESQTTSQEPGEADGEKEPVVSVEGVWNGTAIDPETGWEEFNVSAVVGSLDGEPAALLYLDILPGGVPLLLGVQTSGSMVRLTGEGIDTINLTATIDGDRLTGNLTITYRDGESETVYSYTVNLTRVEGADPAQYFQPGKGEMARIAEDYPIRGSPEDIVLNLATVIAEYLGASDRLVTDYLNTTPVEGYPAARAGFHAENVSSDNLRGARALLFYLNAAALFNEYNYTVVVPPDPVSFAVMNEMDAVVAVSACDPATSTSIMFLVDTSSGTLLMEVGVSTNPQACSMIMSAYDIITGG